MKKFLGEKAVLLIENGCCEREVNQAISAMETIGFSCRIVSISGQSVKGWNENRMKTQSNWGNDFAVDKKLSEAHPSDYSVLVIPGGKRSVEKLKLNKTIRSFISGFLHADKPVVAYNYGIDVLNHFDLINGYSVATAQNSLCESVKKHGGRCASPEFVVSKNLVTLSRYRDAKEKLAYAVSCIMNGEPYIEKIVSFDETPRAQNMVA